MLEPSLAKITLRIQGLDSGMSDEEAETGAEAELKCTQLQVRKTRKAAAADFSDEDAQPRVDFYSPPISPETDRDKSIGIVDVQAEIANAGEVIEQQKQDVEETGIVRAWLEHPDMVPDKNALHTFEPGIQQLWAQRESLEITRHLVSYEGRSISSRTVLLIKHKVNVENRNY